MVQPIGPSSITMQITHDLVGIGLYRLGYWEAIRGFQLMFHAAVRAGLGITSLSNISLQSRLEYYFSHSVVPLMVSEINPILVPPVTNSSPIHVEIPTTPFYPGRVKLQITATVGGQPLLIDSGRGNNYQSDIWFYVVEKESALLAAFALSNLVR